MLIIDNINNEARKNNVKWFFFVAKVESPSVDFVAAGFNKRLIVLRGDFADCFFLFN